MAREGNLNKLEEMIEGLKTSQASTKKDKEAPKDEQRTVYLDKEQLQDLEKISKNLGVKKFSEIIRLVVKAGIASVKEKLGV